MDSERSVGKDCYIHQSIVSRYGEFFSVELICASFPEIAVPFTLANNLENFLFKSNDGQLVFPWSNSEFRTIFVRIELWILVDVNVVKELFSLHHYFSEQGYQIVYSLPFRKEIFNASVLSVIYKMNDNSIDISLSGFKAGKALNVEIIRQFSFVALDIVDVNRMLSGDYNAGIDSLYELKSLGVRLIARNVHKKEILANASALPFDFFQDSCIDLVVV